MKINPNTYLVAIGFDALPKKMEMTGWKQDEITPKQKATLDKYGIQYAHIKYKGQASMLISILTKRANDNMATPKQIQMLLNHGYASGHIKRLTVKGAAKIISELLVAEAAE